MARATKATTKAVEPEEDEFPLGHYMDKEPTQVHENFADYVQEQVGYEADVKTIQLVIALYQKFQKTPEQQKFNADKKAASAAALEEREARRTAKESAADSTPKARTTARKAAAAEPEEEARPARSRRGAVATPPAKRTSGRRRPAADEDDV